MTIEFALAYIPKKMKDMGFENYLLQFRHFIIPAQKTKEINAENQFFYLVDEPAEMLIESEFGVFDLTDDTIEEIMYEHQGQITITNNSSDLTSVRFIQVIPKNKAQCQL